MVVYNCTTSYRKKNCIVIHISSMFANVFFLFYHLFHKYKILCVICLIRIMTLEIKCDLKEAKLTRDVGMMANSMYQFD